MGLRLFLLIVQLAAFLFFLVQLVRSWRHQRAASRDLEATKEAFERVEAATRAASWDLVYIRLMLEHRAKDATRAASVASAPRVSTSSHEGKIRLESRWAASISRKGEEGA